MSNLRKTQITKKTKDLQINMNCQYKGGKNAKSIKID